jgi:hypothetical protein
MYCECPTCPTLVTALTITDIYLTASSSSKICCMAKGAKTFTISSRFVLPHDNFCTCRFRITEDVQSTIHRLKGMVMFNCVECKQSFFGSNVFVLSGYCFLGEIRRYFLTEARIAYSYQMFFCCAAVYRTDLRVL